jgi:uncharacterized membrane protein
MPDLPWLAILMRWIHIVSACLALGGPFFMRYVVAPAAGKFLDPGQSDELRQRVMGRWKYIVYLLILAFIVSGGFNFYAAILRLKGTALSTHVLYQSIFGIKVIFALGMFVLASALTGRSKAFEPIRQRHKLFTTLFLLLGLLVIAGGTILHQLPLPPVTPATAPAP